MPQEILFYVIERVSSGEPLTDDFLFGERCRGEKLKIYSKVGEGEVVHYSKNVARFPKILGRSRLVLPTNLMLDLRDSIKAKWRKVEFTDVFDYQWTESGFEIFDRYINEQEEKAKREGVSEFDIEFHVNSDPTLAYFDFVERFRIAEFEPKTNYWEMVVNNSTYVVNFEPEWKDAVELAWQQGAPVFKRRNKASEKLFSFSSLASYKALSLSSGRLAVMPDQYHIFKPYLESEYFRILPINRLS